MKSNKICWITSLVLVALILTGCLGNSATDKELAENRAELDKLTASFISTLESESLDIDKFLDFFASDMLFSIVVSQPDMKIWADTAANEIIENFNEGNLEELYPKDEYQLLTIKKLLEQLTDPHTDHSSSEIEDLAKQIAVHTVKRNIVEDLLGKSLADEDLPPEVQTDLLKWVNEPHWEGSGLGVSRAVFEVFLAAHHCTLAGSSIIEDPPDRGSRGTYRQLLITLADDKTTPLRLTFSQTGAKYLIESLSLNGHHFLREDYTSE